MNFQNIQMNNGTVLTATKTEELVRYIVNKFSEENLTYDEANIVLENKEYAKKSLVNLNYYRLSAYTLTLRNND